MHGDCFTMLKIILACFCFSFYHQGCEAFLVLKGNRASFDSLKAVNSNIVLGPGSDPEAFDSFKIGSPKVHRYSVETNPDGSTEYVMWYHGRSKNFDSEKALPPLSTGRIGRATSRNGLHWVKDSEGSLSEDAPDVSLGLNTDSWWGFDTAHVGLGSVLLPMSTPAVMMEGGVYMMYFMGGSYEETPVKDYLEAVPESMQNAGIKGMNMKIGIALSQDGISWGRVEGDDPSGACMAPYNSKDPNMKGMASMRDDDDTLLKLEEELYCAWPEVVVRLTNDSSDESNGFFMYYSTMTRNGKEKCIACAVSDDGFRWFKRGICLRPDVNGFDDGGCARGMVVQNAEFDAESRVWREKSGYKMYYEGVSKEDGKHRILLAVSRDGRTWEKSGLALDVGNESEWDCGGVGSPHIIRLDDGNERMYYTGQAKDGSTSIGAACLGHESQKWVREEFMVSFVDQQE